MESAIWAKAHGATTHFPLALALTSAVLDAASVALGGRPSGQGLRSAGHWTMVLAALGTVPAVLSGLIMTRGVVMGHGLLRLHHLFVWPAFALIVALGAWRSLRRPNADKREFAAYLALSWSAAALMAAAATFGGEMMVAR
jgi:uncharacterized membrane protein